MTVFVVTEGCSQERRFASLTRGYSPVTYLVVANLGFTGLLVSWVMKFADSIMKARGR